ncbi:hypothetical protein PYCC9005_002748 [Savitreella phatthalungensis]
MDLTVRVPSYHELSLPAKHIVYQVDVQLSSSLQQYRLSKRYSDFDRLDRELRTRHGNIPTLPPKRLLFSPKLEDRRAGLERYLRQACAGVCAGDKALVSFLEIPGRQNSYQQREGEIGFYDGVRDVRRELQIARRWLTDPPDAVTPPIAEAKRHIARADRFLGKVRHDGQDKISRQEGLRRQDIVESLGREIMALVELASARRDTNDKAKQGHQGKKQQTQAITGRVLGQQQEMPATLALDNQGLLQLQNTQMQQQDQLLETLLPILQRQRELGETIAREVEGQDEVLEQLDGGLGSMQSKMQRGKREMRRQQGS